MKLHSPPEFIDLVMAICVPNVALYEYDHTLDEMIDWLTVVQRQSLTTRDR